MKAEDVIKALNLAPHPEGGFFRETYRSREALSAEHLPLRYGGKRAISTAIYFLLTGDTFSAFHRLRSDEIWHYHLGSPVRLHLLREDGVHEQIMVGPDLDRGHRPQAVIPAGCWFGARVVDPDGFTLVGCTVAPGFDFADFELAVRETLIQTFPMHADLITNLTRLS